MSVYIQALITTIAMTYFASIAFKLLHILEEWMGPRVDPLTRTIIRWACVVVFAVVFVSELGRWDDSDNRSTGERSGVEVIHDALTGCEYLGSNNGLTPRLDRNGNHVCE